MYYYNRKTLVFWYSIKEIVMKKKLIKNDFQFIKNKNENSAKKNVYSKYFFDNIHKSKKY